MFEDNEMCDGKHCPHKRTCARWVMRCDIYSCTQYINFNIKQWPGKCPYWLAIPNDNYPPKPADANY